MGSVIGSIVTGGGGGDQLGEVDVRSCEVHNKTIS